jgi:CelD/BcsL family acetyltransferase involved in cellulose biosynthesis
MKVNSTTVGLLLILAICFSVSGCGQSDAGKLVAEAKEVNSWAASAQMISNAWAQGKVPTAYAHRSFENICQQLGDSTSRMESLSDNHRPQLTALVQQLLALVSQLEAASKAQDRSAISHIDEQLREARATLNSIISDASQTR